MSRRLRRRRRFKQFLALDVFFGLVGLLTLAHNGIL